MGWIVRSQKAAADFVAVYGLFDLQKDLVVDINLSIYLLFLSTVEQLIGKVPGCESRDPGSNLGTAGTMLKK